MGSQSELALSIEAARPGSELTLPSGRHELERTLVVDKALVLRGKDATLVAPKGEVALRVRSSDPVVIEGLAIEASTKTGLEATDSKLTLRELSVRGPGYAESGDGAHGAHVRGGEAVIEGGSYQGFDYGICLDEKARGSVSGVTARDNDGGIGVTGGAVAEVAEVMAEGNRLGVVFHDGGGGRLSRSTLRKNREFGALCLNDASVRIWACFAEENGNDGFNLSGGEGKVSLLRNVCRKNGRHGIYVGKSYAVEIVGNVIDECGRIGIWLDSGATGSARHNFVSRCKQNGIDDVCVNLRDNVGVRNGFAAIGVGGSSSPEVAFNFGAHNSENGIFVTSGAKPNVLFNQLVENGQNGILFSKESAGVARGNLCAMNQWSGLTVAGKSKPTIEGNTFDGNEVNGLTAADSSQAVIKGNLSVENACDGFRLDESSKVLLEGNEARENQEDGISVLARAKPVLRGNRIVGNSDAAIRIVGDDAKPKLEKNTMKDNGENEVLRVEAPDDDEDDDDDDDDDDDEGED